MINRIRQSLLTPGVPLELRSPCRPVRVRNQCHQRYRCHCEYQGHNPIDSRLRVDTYRASRQEDEIHHRRADQPYLYAASVSNGGCAFFNGRVWELLDDERESRDVVLVPAVVLVEYFLLIDPVGGIGQRGQERAAGELQMYDDGVRVGRLDLVDRNSGGAGLTSSSGRKATLFRLAATSSTVRLSPLSNRDDVARILKVQVLPPSVGIGIWVQSSQTMSAVDPGSSGSFALSRGAAFTTTLVLRGWSTGRINRRRGACALFCLAGPISRSGIRATCRKHRRCHRLRSAGHISGHPGSARRAAPAEALGQLSEMFFNLVGR